MAKREANGAGRLPVRAESGSEGFWTRILAWAEEDLDQEKGQAQLEQDARRTNLRLREMEASAKVAQEVAIAKRIQGADEVEVEEFYDTSGSAKLGAAQDAKGLTFGASAVGRLVSRRVIRFKGGAFTNEAGTEQP